MVFSEGLSREDLRKSPIGPDIRIDTTPRKGNAKSAWRFMERELGSQLTDMEKDILDVAQTIYLADRHVERGQGAKALRTIRLLIPLREPERFNPDSLAGLTRELASDLLSFEFVKRRKGGDKWEETDYELPTERDVVCLISGGIDSFGGAIEACEAGLKPILVTHYTSDSRPANAVGEALRQRYDSQMPHVMIGNLKVSGGSLSKLDVEDSMRLRSLLYLSLGAVAASNTGISNLWMSENGILTPGIPFSLSRVGPYTTRTTHPRLVGAFTDWFTELTDHELEISNPLAFVTKAEIIRNIGKRSLTSCLGSTVSCYRRQTAMRHGRGHCGYCVPCIVRRVSFMAAEMEGNDDPKGYLRDCFDLDSIPQAGKVDMVDMTSFAGDFRNLDDNRLVFKYVDLMNLPDTASLERTIDTLKRFSSELLSTLKRNATTGTQRVLGLS